MDLSITDVPRCTSSNEKTFGLKRLQLPNMVASNGPPVELLVEQESIFDYPSIYEACKCPKREQQSMKRQAAARAQYGRKQIPQLVIQSSG